MYLIPNAEKIKNRRRDMNLSAHALSLKAGLNGNAIFRIETGESKLTHNLRANAIAKALGCKTSELFTQNKKGA